MLAYRHLEDLGDAVIRSITEVEQRIINDMARRIALLGEVTAGTNLQALRLEALGTAQQTIMTELSRALFINEKRLFEMFDEAATRTLNLDNRAFTAAGYNPVPLKDNAWLQQIVRAGNIKTKNAYTNLTMTTANTATRQFEMVLDRAYHEMISGGFSYQQAIKSGVQSLSRNGIASIRYPSGHVDYMDVAFRRAALTGINQTCAELQFANMEQMGADLVETTAHHGARPEHALWQGMVFSLSGTHSKYGNFYTETDYGSVTGLCGANCRHSFFPFFEGLSDPAYTADMLRSLNGMMVDYDGDKMSLYDATQRQREIERNIRRWKREASAMEAAGLDSAYAKAKVRHWQAQQRDFIGQTGLTRDYFRERGGKQLTGGGNNAILGTQAGGKGGNIGSSGVNTGTSGKSKDTLAGVERGKPMSFDEAANGRANPNYSKGGGYKENCQSCVVAHEARLRGYNVETLPYTQGSALQTLATQTHTAWKDPKTGNIVARPTNSNTNSAKSYVEYLEKTIKQGKRYTLEFKVNGVQDGWHIVSVDKVQGGIVRIYDPQTGVLHSAQVYLPHYVDFNSAVRLLRVDDKAFNLDVVNKILKGAK